MKQLKAVLALITEDNDYQREQAAVAQTTADRLRIGLQVVYAGNDAIAQTKQILALIHAAASDHIDAIIVEPVGTGMLSAASTAVKHGIGWIVLNREAGYLTQLREEASVPVGSVASDNVEVGRIQGRQFAALLPAGGAVLYIEGPGTEVSKQRRTGLDETLPTNIEIQPVRGRWTEESGFQVVETRLQMMGRGAPNVGVIGCMNDAMAMGARKAVEALPDTQLREQWLQIPFTGVDGVPSTGQVWVKEKLLTTTVITPALSGVALELMSQAIAGGTQMPERTVIDAKSYPAIEELKASAA